MVAQCLGAFMGYGLLLVVTPTELIRPENSTGPYLCTTVPHASLSPLQALAFEYLASTVLILLCCGVWDPRNAKAVDSIPLRFGFAITAIGAIMGPFTGASMNPARTLGPALWTGDYTMHWVIWCELGSLKSRESHELLNIFRSTGLGQCWRLSSHQSCTNSCSGGKLKTPRTFSESRLKMNYHWKIVIMYDFFYFLFISNTNYANIFLLLKFNKFFSF